MLNEAPDQKFHEPRISGEHIHPRNSRETWFWKQIDEPNEEAIKSCNVATMNGITIANYSHDTGRKVLLVN